MTSMLEKIKNNKLLIYISIPILAIITIITSRVIEGEELFIDKLAHDILVKSLRNPTMTTIMKTITKLSDTTYIILIAIILTLLFLFKYKQKSVAKIIPCNLIFITLLNQTLKTIFQRERPFGYHLIEISGFSFPSGHAMVSMAFYGLLIYVMYHLIKNKTLRNTLIIINILIILLIGISRVYLGVHYISDIIVGYSVSIIYLLLFTKLLRKFKIFP